MTSREIFHHTFAAMNTRFSLVLPHVDQQQGSRLARAAEALVQAQERLMSRFDVDSPVSEINRRAGTEAVPVPNALWPTLLDCHRYWQLTAGAFDIAQGARTSLLKAGADNDKADGDTYDGAGGDCGFALVDLDRASQSVRFARPGVQLDLGGIGKGIALDLVMQMFRELDVDCALLSFGESSISVIGHHPAGDYWPVGIADMFDEQRSLYCFNLRDACLSTSGNRNSSAHIVDPHTGAVSSGLRSLSVSCSSATDAEVLSTALLVTSVPQRASVMHHILDQLPNQNRSSQAIEIVYRQSDGVWNGQLEWQYAV